VRVKAIKVWEDRNSQESVLHLNALGARCLDRGQYQLAGRAFNKAMFLQQNFAGPRTALGATIINNLAVIYLILGDHKTPRF
jgi:Flp pilus assembly protein TadD